MENWRVVGKKSEEECSVCRPAVLTYGSATAEEAHVI